MDRNEKAEYNRGMAIAMRRNGWSNEEIAKKLGISATTSSQYTAWIRARKTYTFVESREIVEWLDVKGLAKRIKAAGTGKIPAKADWCVKIGNDYNAKTIEKLKEALGILHCETTEPLIYHRPQFKGIEIFLEDRSEDYEV